MKTLTTPEYSLDDIIFEGRHQAYGAYALRKAYPQHIKRATTYMFAAVGIILAAARLGIAFQPESKISEPLERKVIITDVVLPQTKEKVVEQPTTKPVTKVVPSTPTKRFVNLRIVPDQEPVKEATPNQTDFTAAEPGLEDALGDSKTEMLVPSEAATGAEGSLAGDNTNEVREFVEKMPEFPGGMKQMYDYIRRTLRYPAEAQRLGLEGTVVVTFVVGKTGEISDIKVIKDVGGGTANEAIRVIQSMKPWQPGRQNGQPVPVRFTLPLRFSLAS
ncbi:TonB family protein [Adhaeribacter swui]|uniref:TonB family protein n=1 Tax=Adhaeribacter swui TaxID=2086471 RepID=A0A7G7GA88_9BACT|nr:TonB family protein [Adhaeribacter swui]QNF34072.1 TonB family protein [Adhaeribacter swui]